MAVILRFSRSYRFRTNDTLQNLTTTHEITYSINKVINDPAEASGKEELNEAYEFGKALL